MCGIAGILGPPAEEQELRALAARMAGTLTHRGPDAEGTWCESAAGLALGHRRLRVVDLSEVGHQPMVSSDGRWVLNYNGELYNAPYLAARLRAEGARFAGHSDTEVFVEAIAAWGVEGALASSNGMFAFAVWDRSERQLTLVRDRLGEKPLYYGRAGSTFVFASELGALRAHPDFDSELSRDALTLFMRYGYVPGTWSIHRDARKLAPGCRLTLHARDPVPWDAPQVPYWTVPIGEGPGPEDPRQAADELDAHLRASVRARLAADVPVGAFLSGGIDSSLVVALMQDLMSEPVRTFTIGFDDPRYDESGHARAIARHLGTVHTEQVVTARDALAAVPRLATVYDEPFADSSQLPTLLLAELARSDVTVALSGDGGDELFSGYARYGFYDDLWHPFSRVPREIRRGLSRIVTSFRPDTLDRLALGVHKLVPSRLRTDRPGTKAHQAAAVLAADSADDAYLRLMSKWHLPELVVVGGEEPLTLLSDPSQWPHVEPVAERVAWLDAVGYLPDDLLVKVDRATMAVSLEARLPLLDHHVVEFARELPYNLKVRDGARKWIVTEVLHRYLPRRLFERPKMGFGVPVGSWLRRELRPWTEDLLSPSRLATEGFLDAELVTTAWRAHRDGRADHSHRLWNVLMFQAWHEHVQNP